MGDLSRIDARVNRLGACPLMFKVVGLQVFVAGVVVVLAGVIGGQSAAVSALLGGGVCLIPNALFAARLRWVSRKPQGAGVLTFLVGEFVKLGLTLALLVAVVQGYDKLVWLAMIIAIIACLKSYLLVFWLDRIQYK